MKISANFIHLRRRHQFMSQVVLLRTFNGLRLRESHIEILYRVAIPLVPGSFSEKFEKLRHCPRPGLEPRTERKSKILSYKTPGMSGIATV